MNELDLFAAAIAITEPAERAALLERECAGRPELRRRLDQLLEAHSRPEPMLDRPGLDPTGDDPAAEVGDRPSGNDPVIDATLDRNSPDRTRDHSASGIVIGLHRAGEERAGVVIAGKYTLVEVVGEGGMGSVWRAKQTEPVKRFVAVKLIKAGMDSRQVLARFDAERQALALMDHPNIARIYDGGVTEAGQPYFVMELVDGMPLTEYCDRKRLSVRDRLELFVSVCQAVQHAHQKGIIHRDLKPGNVLVTEVDGRATPKVIDFGVAKATEQKLTDLSFADTGALVGTPAYMSPEQADPTSMDIDTRTDVYALGVMLYELLTGVPPIDASQFKRGAILELLRMVREVDPPRPSTRLSTADALPNIAANRSVEPARLSKLLRGELDWVVMKAIEKDRTRRYDTANGFARDIQRYLADEVIEARPPSRGYRLKKFVRRNRPQVIAASLVLLALVAGVVGTAVGLVEAKQQQKRAEAGEKLAGERLVLVEAEKKRVEAERKRADEERQVAQAVNDFLQKKLLAQADTTAQADALLQGGGWAAEAKYNPTVKELLDQAAKELAPDAIEANFPNQPRVQAEILRTVGNTYRGVGEAATGVPFLTRSVELFQAKLGPDHPDALTSMNNLAEGYRAAGQLDKALPLYEETLRLTKAKLGPDHPDALRDMNNLAVGYHDAGQRDKALPLFEEALKLMKAKLGPDHPNTLNTMANLATGYFDAGQRDKALPLYEETLKLLKAKLGPDHPDTLRSMNNLAVVYRFAGQLDKALPLYEETLKLLNVKLGPDHPNTLSTMGSLADCYRGADKLALALPLYEETLRLRKAKLRPDHPSTLNSMGSLAVGYRDAGQLDKALPLFEETLRLKKAKLGPDHPDTLSTMGSLAVGFRVAGQLDKALPLFEETLRLRKAKLGPDHPDTLESMFSLATGLRAAGRLDKALPLFEETLRLRKAKIGPDHPDTLNSMNALALGYHADEKLDKAVPLYEETLRLRKAKLGPDHPDTLTSMNNLASGYQAAGRLDKALPLFEETLKLLKAKLGPDHPDTLTSMNNLALGYEAAGKLDQAVPLLKETLKLTKAKLGPDHPDTLRSMGNLGKTYCAAKQGDKAAETLTAFVAGMKKRYPPGHPQLAGLLAQVSLDLIGCGQFTPAEPLLRDCLAIREKTMADSWLTFNTQSLLGGALLGQKKYSDAETLLVKGYEGMKAREATIPPQGSTRIPEALDRLIELYTATNKRDEAAKYQAERAKYPEAAPVKEERK